MKQIIVIAIALITVNATAQDQKRERKQEQRKERAQRMSDFSPEEIATLQTKKMTLQLDLTEAQQKELKAFHLEQAKSRKAAMEAHKQTREEGKETKPSKEDRFNRANKLLDNKIATKAKLKKILNKEQFEKWERSQVKRGQKARSNRSKQHGQRRVKKQRN